MSVFAAPPTPHRFQAEEEAGNTSVASTSDAQGQEVQVEQWYALAKIIHDVGPALDPSEELADLLAAETAVNDKERERDAITETLNEEIDALTRELKKATSKADRPSNQPTPQEHESQIRALEQQQYTTSKILKEEQGNVTRKEADLAKWKAEREEVERLQVGDEAGYLDGKAIRLSMMNSSGFTLVPAKENAPAKVIIRNEAKNDIHAVTLDTTRSKVYNANAIWTLAGE